MSTIFNGLRELMWRTLLYIKDQSENFTIDLTDDLDAKEIYLELKKYLKN